MICNKRVSVVIPCKNEERALQTTLRALPNGIDEIIVVDNGSTDNTVKTAILLGANVLYDPRNDNGIGYGFALSKGIEQAKGDIIICMDGDGSYPVSEIPKLVAHLESRNIDFISCNRLPFQKPRKMSAIRAFGVIILNVFVRLLFGYKIKDSLTGMWVIRKKILSSITLLQGGWNFSLEIKLKAITNPKIRFSEYNIPYQDRIFDSSKLNIFKAGIEHVIFLFKVKFFNMH